MKPTNFDKALEWIFLNFDPAKEDCSLSILALLAEEIYFEPFEELLVIAEIEIKHQL